MVSSVGTTAVVVVEARWAHEATSAELEGLARAFTDRLQQHLAEAEATIVSGQPPRWVLAAREPARALGLALELAGDPELASDGEVVVAVGAGDLQILGGHLLGWPAHVAQLLAGRAAGGGVYITSEVLRRSGLPAGVGAHHAPSLGALEALRLEDFRGPVPRAHE